MLKYVLLLASELAGISRYKGEGICKGMYSGNDSYIITLEHFTQGKKKNKKANES